MYFLNPSALWSAAILPVVVLLHLLQRPRQSYWVSNWYLWPTAPAQGAARLLFTRPKPNWLLLLQLLFLAAVILALAQPVLSLRHRAARRIGFIFDASASMYTLEAGRSRFDMARETALALLARLNQDDVVSIIQAKAQPVMIGDFLADKQALRRIILGLSPTHVPADLTAALLLALPVADEIYLFSDGTENATPPPALQVDKVHYVQVGESANNLAISRLEVRRNPLSPYDQELFAEVINLSNQSHTARFVLSIGATTLRKETVTLDPGARRALVAGSLSNQQGMVTAHIVAEDHLAVDNRAYAVLRPPRLASVLVVSNGNRFVDTALDLNPLYERTTISPAAYARGEVRTDFDVVVFDGFQPPELTQGRYLVINPQPSHSRLLQADISTPHPRHPVMTFVDTSAIVVEQGTPLGVSPGATVLLEAADQPLLVAYERPGLKKVALGFDLYASNLPLTVAFPILMSNILQWLTTQQGPAHSQLSAGEPLYWDTPPALGLREVTITTPQGATVSTTLSDHSLAFEATDMTGIYTIRGQGYTRRFAVNLNNAAESNIRPVFVPGTDWEAPSRASLYQKRVGLWQYLLAAALLILATEWWYSCRRGSS